MRKFLFLIVLCVSFLSARNVPYFRQSDFVGFGSSACGPTSISMILKYYYPYSQVNPGKIYHSGGQAYKYNGPVRFYKNAGYANFHIKNGLAFKDNGYTNKYYIGNYSGMIHPENLAKDFFKRWNLVLIRKYVSNLKKEEAINLLKSSPLLVLENGHYLLLLDYVKNDDKFFAHDPWVLRHKVDNNFNFIKRAYISYKYDKKFATTKSGKNIKIPWQYIKNNFITIYQLLPIEGSNMFIPNNYSTLVGPEDSNIDAYVYGKNFNIYGYKYKVYNHPINDWTYKLNENNQTAWYKIYDPWIDNIKGPQKFNEMEINYHSNVDDIYYSYGNGRNFIFLNKKNSYIDSVKWKPAIFAESIFDLTYNFFDCGPKKNLTFYLKDEKGNTLAKQIVSYTNSKTDKHIPLFQKVELKNGYYVEVDKVPYNINLGSIFFQDYHNSFGSFVNKCYHQMNSSRMSLSKDCKLWLFQKTSKKQLIRIWAYFKNYHFLANTSYNFNLFNDKFLNFINQISTLYITRAKFAKILTQAFSDKLKYCSQKERNTIIIMGNILKKTPIVKYKYNSFLYKWLIENKWTIDGVILRFNNIWYGRDNDMLKDNNITNFMVLITLQRIFKKASK